MVKIDLVMSLNRMLKRASCACMRPGGPGHVPLGATSMSGSLYGGNVLFR